MSETSSVNHDCSTKCVEKCCKPNKKTCSDSCASPCDSLNIQCGLCGVPCSPFDSPYFPCGVCGTLCNPCDPSCSFFNFFNPSCGPCPAKRYIKPLFKNREPLMCCDKSKKNGLQLVCPMVECCPHHCALAMPQGECAPENAFPQLMRNQQ